MGNEGEGIGHLSLSDVTNNKAGTDISTKASSEDGNNVQNITVFVKDTVIGDVAEISIMKAKIDRLRTAGSPDHTIPLPRNSGLPSRKELWWMQSSAHFL